AQPRIVGGLLTAGSAAVCYLPSVHLDTVPRMADFCYWVVAAEPALPWEQGTFLATYQGNRDEAVDVVLEASTVALPLLGFLERRPDGWTGTAKEVLNELDSAGG